MAEYEENVQPSPMMVLSKELMEVLHTSRITTSLKPLALPPIVVPRKKARKYFKYAQHFGRSFHELAAYFKILRPALFGYELGWVEHVRDQDGTLRWSMTGLGVEKIEDGTVDTLAQSGKPLGSL